MLVLKHGVNIRYEHIAITRCTSTSACIPTALKVLAVFWHNNQCNT